MVYATTVDDTLVIQPAPLTRQAGLQVTKVSRAQACEQARACTPRDETHIREGVVTVSTNVQRQLNMCDAAFTLLSMMFAIIRSTPAKQA